MTRKKGTTVVIRYSCLTGKAVWLYYSPSDAALWKAYWRARQAEAERVRNWDKRQAQRKSNILRILSDCTASLPITDDLPPEKREAARRLRQIAEATMPCYREFYDHMMEERRRRRGSGKINENSDYDK